MCTFCSAIFLTHHNISQHFTSIPFITPCMSEIFDLALRKIEWLETVAISLSFLIPSQSQLHIHPSISRPYSPLTVFTYLLPLHYQHGSPALDILLLKAALDVIIKSCHLSSAAVVRSRCRCHSEQCCCQTSLSTPLKNVFSRAAVLLLISAAAVVPNSTLYYHKADNLNLALTAVKMTKSTSDFGRAASMEPASGGENQPQDYKGKGKGKSILFEVHLYISNTMSIAQQQIILVLYISTRYQHGLMLYTNAITPSITAL